MRQATLWIDVDDPTAERSLAGGQQAELEEQMAALRELVDSGQLTDDDKREIKKMFAESLGGGDVDEKIREANKNRDQLDAQAREALDLLNKLMV